MAIQFDRGSVLLRVHGTFGGSVTAKIDEWSVGFRLAPITAGMYPSGDLQAFMAGCNNAFLDFHTNATTNSSSQCWIDHMSAAFIGLDGKYLPVGQLTELRDFTVKSPGTGSQGQPYSTALVTSLRTNIPRGRGSNGRMYWPYLGALSGPVNGRLPDATVMTYATNAQTLLKAINTAASGLGGGTRLVVMSGLGQGTTGLVTSLRVDGRMDTQERRENKQPSVYQSKPV